MTQRKIVWEKWVDPLNKNIDEVEYPGHNYPSYDDDRPIEFLSSDPEFEERAEEAADGHESDPMGVGKNISYNPIRIVSTPHGFVSLTEHSFASKHFDFWTMHYNRNITRAVIDEIEKCDGVETINALTRYRVRIGFNRPLIQSGAFNLTKVRKDIEKAIFRLESKKRASNFFEIKNDNTKKNIK